MKDCIAYPEINKVFPHFPNFTKAKTAIKHMQDHPITIDFNFYKMNDEELKKTMAWINKHRCENSGVLTYRNAKKMRDSEREKMRIAKHA